MKVRCPNCKAVLRVPEPDQPVEGKPVEKDYLSDVLGFLNRNCNHPDNVKVSGKCLACEQERRKHGS